MTGRVPAALVAERIRRATEALPLGRSVEVPVTVSIGVASTEDSPEPLEAAELLGPRRRRPLPGQGGGPQPGRRRLKRPGRRNTLEKRGFRPEPSPDGKLGGASCVIIVWRPSAPLSKGMRER